MLEKHINIDLIVDNATNVSVTINKNLLYVTEEEFNERLEKNIEGIVISDDTTDHDNQYLKLFSVENLTSGSTSSVLFKFTDTYSTDFDMLINLDMNYAQATLNVIYKNNFSRVDNIEKYIFATEQEGKITVYYQIPDQSMKQTPTLKILSFQKQNNEVLKTYFNEYQGLFYGNSSNCNPLKLVETFALVKGTEISDTTNITLPLKYDFYRSESLEIYLNGQLLTKDVHYRIVDRDRLWSKQ